MLCSVTQSCPTLCNPMDCSPPGSSVCGIFQARILEWVAIASSRGSSCPRDGTHVSCIGRQILYHCVTWEVPHPARARARAHARTHAHTHTHPCIYPMLTAAWITGHQSFFPPPWQNNIILRTLGNSLARPMGSLGSNSHTCLHRVT